MGLNLSTNLPMFVYTFQEMWRHRHLEEYLIFVGIRAAYTSFSPFTLGRPSHQSCVPAAVWTFTANPNIYILRFINIYFLKFEH